MYSISFEIIDVFIESTNLFKLTIQINSNKLPMPTKLAT